MNFIFQYDYINLRYLNLEKKNLTDKGIKTLQNKSLKNLYYLNLLHNYIIDKGLIYLNELSNLNELILLNMDKLSDDYFYKLQFNSFINRLKILKCDKKILTLEYINSNYNNFTLPNLTCLTIISHTMKIQKEYKILFELNNICSRITDLNLSGNGILDNGMLRLTKNISVFKKIERVNLENTLITTKCEKYFYQLKKLNIKIKIKNTTNTTNKNIKNTYKICLGGSTIEGKTTYIKTYMNKSFQEIYLTTVGFDRFSVQAPAGINKNVNVIDTSRWEGRFGSAVRNLLYNIDGVILLFDLSKKEDFNKLPSCLEMISDYYEIEDFPIFINRE